MDAETQNEEETKEEEGEEEAGLAQALVGLRVRARNKTGIKGEGYKDHRWLRGSGYLRLVKPSVERKDVKSKELKRKRSEIFLIILSIYTTIQKFGVT